MARFTLFLMIFLVLVMGVILALQPNATVQALPEYSAQVGEPCSSCHISPSGGGARTPRGQAWVAEMKPGVVPELRAALELLGVSLEIDESSYLPPIGEVPAAGPLTLPAGQPAELHTWLYSYEGN
jgi:hypothetical protein